MDSSVATCGIGEDAARGLKSTNALSGRFGEDAIGADATCGRNSSLIDCGEDVDTDETAEVADNDTLDKLGISKGQSGITLIDSTSLWASMFIVTCCDSKPSSSTPRITGARIMKQVRL